jgi:hypothetical protein
MLAQNNAKTPIRGTGITEAYDRVVNKVIKYTTFSGKVLNNNGNKKPYDKLFHLFMVLTMEDGTFLVLEKNEVIKLSVYNGRKGAEELKISKPPSRTLEKVLEKTEDRMGYSYHRYDAIKNNCQDFLMNILNANKFGSAAAKAFIKQDVKGLIGKSTQKALSGATRLFGIAQTLVD